MTPVTTNGMTRITLSFLLSLLSDSFPGQNGPVNTKRHWSYKGPEGPDNWPLHYKHCAGVRQSPIDIVPAQTVFNPDLDPFHLENFHAESQTRGPVMLNITNNGHAGGGLNGTFKTAEFHFHWGSRDDMGSEHALYGRKFPLEMHVVNFAEKYGNINDAMTQPDGLAVLGVFFELSDQDNPAFSALDDALRVVNKAGEHNLVDRLRLRYLLPLDISRYWRYSGSLTTPFCFESVTWTVFTEPQKISRKQLETLRSLLHEDGHDSAITHVKGRAPSRLVDNWRPLQPLNGRTVYRSFDNGPANQASIASKLVSSHQAQNEPNIARSLPNSASPVSDSRMIQLQTHHSDVLANESAKDSGSVNGLVKLDGHLDTQIITSSDTDTDTASSGLESQGSLTNKSDRVLANTHTDRTDISNGFQHLSASQQGSFIGGAVRKDNTRPLDSLRQPLSDQKIRLPLTSYPRKLGKLSPQRVDPNGVAAPISYLSPTASIPRGATQPVVPLPSVFDKLQLSLSPNGTARSQSPVINTNAIPGPLALQNSGFRLGPGVDLTNNPADSRFSQTSRLSALQHMLNKGSGGRQRVRTLNDLKSQQQFLQLKQQQQQPIRLQPQQAALQTQLPQQRPLDSNFRNRIAQRPYRPYLQQLARQRQQQQQQKSQLQQQTGLPQIPYVYKQPQNSRTNSVKMIGQINQNVNQASSAGQYQQQAPLYVIRTKNQRGETRPSPSPQQIRTILEKLAATNRIKTVPPRTLNSAAARIQTGKAGTTNSVQRGSFGGGINRAPLTIIRNPRGRLIASRLPTIPQAAQQAVQRSSGFGGSSTLRQTNFPNVRMPSANQRPAASLLTAQRGSTFNPSAPSPSSLPRQQRRYGTNQGYASAAQTRVQVQGNAMKTPQGYASAAQTRVQVQGNAMKTPQGYASAAQTRVQGQGSAMKTPQGYASATQSRVQGQGNAMKTLPRAFFSQSGGPKFRSGSDASANAASSSDGMPFVFLHRMQQPVRIRRPYYEKLYNMQGQSPSDQLLSLHRAAGEFNEFH